MKKISVKMRTTATDMAEVDAVDATRGYSRRHALPFVRDLATSAYCTNELGVKTSE